MAGLYDNLICWTGPPGYIYRLAEKSIPELLKRLQIGAQDDGRGGGGLKVTVCAPDTGNRKFSPETCFETAERFSRMRCIVFKLTQNRMCFERKSMETQVLYNAVNF
jgi:hypothetical protein